MTPMNARALYPIYHEPVELERVIDGLWVTSEVQTPCDSEAEYFRSVELFKRPMIKAVAAKISTEFIPTKSDKS